MSTTQKYGYYSPEAAAAVSTAIWTAVRRREMPRDWGLILECLIWRCRIPGRDRVIVSVTEIVARTGGAQRTDVVAAGDFAHERGWLRKINRRQVVWCEALGRNVGRQATTEYVFQTPLEFARDQVLSPNKSTKRKRGLGASLMAMAALLVGMQKQDPAKFLVLQEAIKTIQEAPRPDVVAMLGLVPALPSPEAVVEQMVEPVPPQIAVKPAPAPIPSQLADIRAERAKALRASPRDMSRAFERRPVLADVRSFEDADSEEAALREAREAQQRAKAATYRILSAAPPILLYSSRRNRLD